MFQLSALLLAMYHVVSAVFISSIFSVPLQQLHAEPGSLGRSTRAGLEIQCAVPVPLTAR